MSIVDKIIHYAGDFKAGNYTIYGTPTITSDGIVSGFSTNNYLQLPTFSPGSNAWEGIFEVTMGAIGGGMQLIVAGNAPLLEVFLQTAGTIKLNLSSTSTSWMSSVEGSHVYQEGVTYLLRVKFDLSQYTLEYSTDNGSTWATDITIANTTAVYSGKALRIGRGHGTDYPFLGSVNLKNCFVKINDEVVWDNVYNEDVYGDFPFMLKRKSIRYYKNVEVGTTETWRCYTSDGYYLYTKPNAVAGDPVYFADFATLPAATSISELMCFEDNPCITSITNDTLVWYINIGVSDGYTTYSRNTAYDLTETTTTTEIVEGTSDDYDFNESEVKTYLLKRSGLGIISAVDKFESSIAGTYSIVLAAGDYEITLVGGGGSGGGGTKHSNGASGGSGAFITAYVTLEAGTYSVAVGGGGDATDWMQYRGANGEASSFGDLLIAGGGATGVTDSNGGAGGTVTINTITNGSASAPGGSGSGGYGWGNTSNTASVYNGYGYGGAGGVAGMTGGSAGGNGYAKITMVEHNGIVQTPYILRRK